MLDYYKWDSFVNNKYAQGAIGSPTLNMWVASWNKKYPEEKIYCNNTNQLGYYVGISDKPTSESVNVSSMAGYQVSEANNMYFPHKRGVNVNTCQGYWLASTSAYNRMRINIVGYNGDVTYDNDDDGDLGVRCVVCLKSEVCITENADWSVTLK